MDLAGPKLRTGPIEPGPAALKYRPKRDALGRVVSPARIWLTPSSTPELPPEPADAILLVPRAWLSRLKRTDCVRFTDARGASRAMTIAAVVGASRWAEAVRMAYIVPGLTLEIRRSGRSGGYYPRLTSRCWRHSIERTNPSLETWRYLGSHQIPGARTPSKYDSSGKLVTPARIGVSLSEFFDSVRPGEPIWLDDGKIGGVVRCVTPEASASRSPRRERQGKTCCRKRDQCTR
jgi:pyruvate kinase